MRENSVVFPAPLSPSRIANPPASSAIETLLSTCRAPNRWLTALISSAIMSRDARRGHSAVVSFSASCLLRARAERIESCAGMQEAFLGRDGDQKTRPRDEDRLAHLSVPRPEAQSFPLEPRQGERLAAHESLDCLRIDRSGPDRRLAD